MNRNDTDEISEMSAILADEKNSDKINSFIIELLTKSEVETLSKRWRILKMLSEDYTQREIAKELKVSLCKVTRGAQILKNEKSVAAQYIKKGKTYEH